MSAPLDPGAAEGAKVYFQSIEQSNSGTQFPLQEILDRLRFDDKSLIPAITQDVDSGEVLMLAWMNREALEATLNTGKMTYWSRSRQSFWVKGETSGHTQSVVSASLDCDGDALLFVVRQHGGACHTGRSSCFYLAVDAESDSVTIVSDAPG